MHWALNLQCGTLTYKWISIIFKPLPNKFTQCWFSLSLLERWPLIVRPFKTFHNVIRPNGSNSESFHGGCVMVKTIYLSFYSLNSNLQPVVCWRFGIPRQILVEYPFLSPLSVCLSFGVRMRVCCIPVSGNHSRVSPFTLTEGGGKSPTLSFDTK